ncbi:MAG: hypothetical protein HY219_02265 [Candidatus Staskawiczbacteria bacterium]|nr:hypothetical protein [Candidatus Staskawiczbacteria bacterium]
MSEIFAIFIESLIYYFVLEIDYKKAFFLSVAANFESFSLGFILKI